MAKKTYTVQIDTAAKLKAFEALLLVMGFTKSAANEYIEASPIRPSVKAKPKSTTKSTTAKSTAKQKPNKKGPVKK